MREVDFFKLPRPIQERFVAATQGTVPAPLLVSRPRRVGPFLWGLGALAALSAAVGLSLYGFGELSSSSALQPSAFGIGYVVCFAAAVFCGLRAHASAQREVLSPYRPWVYLFPIGVVDARSPRFRVHPLTEVAQATSRGTKIVLVFSDATSFEFEVGDAKNVELGLQAIAEAQRLNAQAEQSQSRRDRALLDPLTDTGFSNPFAPTVALVPRRALPAWAAALLAVLLGAVIGVGAFKLRNLRSEAALYLEARRADDADSYRAYLERGGERPEVNELLLPRAELRKVQQSGSVEAIEAFIERYPDSKIKAEIAAVHREILLAQLKQAIEAGTLGALRAFEERHPRHDLVKKEIAAAKRQVYQAALEKFTKSAARDPKLVAFFGRLLEHARVHGPAVELRFQRRFSPSNEKIEQALMKSTYYMGQHLLPSRYFNGQHAEQREQKTAAVLLERLQAEFPVDVLKFELAEPVSTELAELPPVKVPTLFIEHHTQMNGLYLNRNPRGVFVGLGLLFRATFKIPDQDEELNFKFSMWRPPDLSVLKEEDGTPEQVYELAASEAFDNFMSRFLKSFFAN